jgi:hypothetical protein
MEDRRVEPTSLSFDLCPEKASGTTVGLGDIPFKKTTWKETESKKFYHAENTHNQNALPLLAVRFL